MPQGTILYPGKVRPASDPFPETLRRSAPGALPPVGLPEESARRSQTRLLRSRRADSTFLSPRLRAATRKSPPVAVSELDKEREKLLPPQRKRIEAAWSGLGERLAVQQDGSLRLTCKAVARWRT